MQTDQLPLSESGSSTSSLNRAIGAIPISSSSSSNASPDSLMKRHVTRHAHTSPRLSSSSAPGSASNSNKPAPLASVSAAALHHRAYDPLTDHDELHDQQGATMGQFSLQTMPGIVDLSQGVQNSQHGPWISSAPVNPMGGALKSDDPNLASYRQPRRHRSNALRSNSSDDGDSPFASDSDVSYGADVDMDVLNNDEEGGSDSSAPPQSPNSQSQTLRSGFSPHKPARLLQEVAHQNVSPRSTGLLEPPRQYAGLSNSASNLLSDPARQYEDRRSHASKDSTSSSSRSKSRKQIPVGPNFTAFSASSADPNSLVPRPAFATISDTEMTGIDRKPKWTDEYATDDDIAHEGMDSSMEDVHLYAPFQLERMDTDGSSMPTASTITSRPVPSSLSLSSSSVGHPAPAPFTTRPQRPASSIISYPITRTGSQELAPAASSSAATTPRRGGRDEALVMKATKNLVQTYQLIQRNIKHRRDVEEAGARSKAATAPYYYPRMEEVLCGRYKVAGYLGRGSFGVVVKAIVLDAPAPSRSASSSGSESGEIPELHSSTDSIRSEFLQPQKMVAIKMSRKGSSFLQQGKREVSILDRIHMFQATQANQDLDLFVRALDSFFHEGHLCIVFELLADSLFDLVKYSWEVRPDRPGLSLRMVRKMAHQLICALITLRNSKIIHCDLKPENIALAQPNRPRLKILDFGSSCLLSDSPINQFPYIQSRYYRAPEILLGTGYSCAIDMWSLGCIIAELYLGRPIFEGSNSITQLYCIIDVLGMPTEAVLKNAAHLTRYFQRVGSDSEGRSVLDPTVKTHQFTRTSIRELIESKNEPNTPLHIRYFTDLVTRMLEWDPAQRITPLEAVNHNFILYGPKTNADGN